ncbi:MAG: hypothetical protein KBT57_01915 [bacterium]|nr:hypothetical protein [Candidatus Limimorpha equi]
MKEYKEESSFRHLDIIGDVYSGLFVGMILFIAIYSNSNANNYVDVPIWADIFVLFSMMLLTLAGGFRTRHKFIFNEVIRIDKDEQIVEVEFYEGFSLRYKIRRIPFSDLEIKFGRVRVGSKPSNRVVCGISIIDNGELVFTCGWSDKWTNGGFDELVAEFSSIKEEYCEKKTDLLSD